MSLRGAFGFAEAISSTLKIASAGGAIAFFAKTSKSYRKRDNLILFFFDIVFNFIHRVKKRFFQINPV